MGKELMEDFPSFRRMIQDLDSVLQTLPEESSWPLQEALLDPEETSQINHVTRSQLVCLHSHSNCLRPITGEMGHSPSRRDRTLFG